MFLAGELSTFNHRHHHHYWLHRWWVCGGGAAAGAEAVKKDIIINDLSILGETRALNFMASVHCVRKTSLASPYHPSQEVCTILPQPLSRWLIPIIITIIIISSGSAVPFQIPIVCAFNIPVQRDTDTIHTISVTYCSPSPHPPPTQCACHCPPQTRIPQPTYNFHCWVTPHKQIFIFHFDKRKLLFGHHLHTLSSVVLWRVCWLEYCLGWDIWG